MGEGRKECVPVPAMADIAAYVLGLGTVEDDEEVPATVAAGLRRGGLRFLVAVLAVDDRREPLVRVAPHVLPDVEDGAAGRVDERAAMGLELLQLFDRDAEGRKNDHVVGAERVKGGAGVAEEEDALGAQLVIDVW